MDEGSGHRADAAPAWRRSLLLGLGVTVAAALALAVLDQVLAWALLPGLAAVGLARLGAETPHAPRPPAPIAAVTPQPEVAISVAELFEQPVIMLDERLFVRGFTPQAKVIFPALEAGRVVALAVRDPDALALLDRARTADDEIVAQVAELIGAQRQWRMRVRRMAQTDRPGAARVVALLEDISEQRALERLRVDFVANASHELRTPLASLLGYVETLQGPARNDPAARERFLAIMREQATRMARLIDDLLSLSRAELRAHQAPRGDADLALAVREIIESLRLSAQDRGVAIHLDAPATPVMLRADRDDLLRLCENLIENALKYGRDGKRVDVSIAVSDRTVELSVRDHGAGIAPEHIPRLTERFYRIDASHSRETGGTGLGLAIVKHIAARHGAKLEIESRLGEGSRFAVIFPAQAALDNPKT